MTDDIRLQRRYAQQHESQDSSEAHPTEETWEALAGAELSEAEQRVVKDHALRCHACARIYRGLLTLEQEAREMDSKLSVEVRATIAKPRANSQRYLLPALAAAASIVALVLLLPFVQRQVVEDRPGGVLEPPTVDQRRAATQYRPRDLQPVGVLNAPPQELRWSPVASVAMYRVEVLDGEGELIWASDVAGAAFAQLPDDLVRSEGLYYWRVLTLTGAGSQGLASELVSFELRMPD